MQKSNRGTQRKTEKESTPLVPLACFALAALLAFCLLLSGTARGIFATHAPAENEKSAVISAFRICLDAGHGGADAGAVVEDEAGNLVREKDLVLTVAQKIGARLEAAGFEVLYTRTDDKRMSAGNSRQELRTRLAFCAEQEIDLLLSLHANAYRGAGRAYGARIYHNPENILATRAAALLGEAVSQHTGALIGRNARVEADSEYTVLEDSERAALLVEMGFLTDRRELALMLSEEWQNTFSDAVCEALVALLKE